LETIDIKGRRYKLSSLMNRWFGQFLDGLIYLAILACGLVIQSITDWVLAVIVAALVALGYLLFQDGFENGQSWGKKLVKTRVIDAKTAATCTFGQSFLRNLLLALLSWIDWVFIFGDRRQRLGDRAAKTIVVDEQDMGRVDWQPENPTAEWFCPKCSNGNPNTTFACTGCGYSLR
jgi:uncharacterized RDD family membrane protein YckC